MANPFLGLNVQVKLKHPPSTLHGHVVDVQGQQLVLKNVLFLKSGKRLQDYRVHGLEILDIEVLPDELTQARPTASQQQPLQAHPNPTVHSSIAPKPPVSTALKPSVAALRPTQLPPTSTTTFADPAILSYQRTPVKEHVELQPIAPQTAPTRPAQVVPASLIEPFDTLQVKGTREEPRPTTGATEDARHEDSLLAVKGSTSGKPRAVKKHGVRAVKEDLEDSHEILKKDTVHDTSSQSGWRQTPILQPQTTPRSSKHGRTTGLDEGRPPRDVASSAKRSTDNNRRQRALDKEASKNGWGTEDATDVKDMGDFDFEDNLSRFDKKAVWAELRAGDTTADEDRLVSFNRVKGPAGTFGGQKLHPTENVLGGSRRASVDFDDTESDLDLGASTSTRRLRHSHSRASMLPPSRKDSMRTDTQAASHAMTGRSLSRRKLTDQAAQSPQISAYMASPPSSSFSASGAPPANTIKSELRYLSSNRPCRTVTPDTFQAIETLAKNGFGMTDDILDENAGRCIAELVLSTLDPSGQRLSKANHNALPIVVLLIGENKTGARALAAARHLLERNVRVIASLVGEIDLEKGPLGLQVQRFRGKVVHSWPETLVLLKTSDAPPELVVDALLGSDDGSVSKMSSRDYDTVVLMAEWAASQRAPVLTIDHSGDDLNGGLRIHPRIIICCGIPSSNLVARLALDVERARQTKLYVADIGLNPAARPFMKMRTKDEGDVQKGRFVQFGSEWVVGLKFSAEA